MASLINRYSLIAVVVNERVYLLDLAAKLDETAHFLCSELWKGRGGEEVEFPAPFGRDLTVEVWVSSYGYKGVRNGPLNLMTLNALF